MKHDLQAARIPTWVKAKLLNLKYGTGEDRSYEEFGWHLAYHHLEDFDLNLVDAPRPNQFVARPTQLLRSIFRDNPLSRDELVSLVPKARRRGFLRGVIIGALHYRLREWG